MSAQQRFWRWLRAEQGSQSLEAAGAALAAAFLVLALLAGARTALGPSVREAFECAAAALGAGGATCGGGGASGAETAQNSAPNSPGSAPQQESCGGLCQVGGFFKGVGEGLWDTVVGIGTLAADGFRAATGDQETRDKYAGLWDAITSDPLGTGRTIVGAIVEPIVSDWQQGRYGEAIGRGVFEVISTIGGPKGLDKAGKLGKVDDIARVAGRSDEIGDTGRAIRQLPCVTAAPGGKGPGLAKPLAEGCTRGTRAAAASRRAEQASIDAARRVGGDIDYGQLDAAGRPTGIRATITRDMINTGSEPNPNIRPPGFDSTQGHARGHLLGNQLGGSGKVDSNLVTLHQNPVNSPVMRDFETSVRRAVEAGEVIQYEAIPVYVGNNPIPTAVTMRARGNRGFNLEVSVINRP